MMLLLVQMLLLLQAPLLLNRLPPKCCDRCYNYNKLLLLHVRVSYIAQTQAGSQSVNDVLGQVRVVRVPHQADGDDLWTVEEDASRSELLTALTLRRKRRSQRRVKTIFISKRQWQVNYWSYSTETKRLYTNHLAQQSRSQWIKLEMRSEMPQPRPLRISIRLKVWPSWVTSTLNRFENKSITKILTQTPNKLQSLIQISSKQFELPHTDSSYNITLSMCCILTQ